MTSIVFKYIQSHPVLVSASSATTGYVLSIVEVSEMVAAIFRTTGVICAAFLSALTLVVYFNNNFYFVNKFPFIKVKKDEEKV